MFDDVEGRAFLVQPARKYPPPAAVALLDVELDEGARQPLILPRRARLARAKPDHRVANADRLPGPEREVADNAVALVEQPEHRDPFGHRRHPRRGLDRARHIDRHRIAVIRGARAVAALVASASEHQRHHRERDRAHDQSGFHA